jgi:phosphomannomutase
MFPSHIFKAYDIRGLVAADLSEHLAYAIGRAFVRVLRENQVALDNRYIVVGHDMRPTSPQFEAAVIDGIEAEGARTILVGEVSTPLFNFSVAHYSAHAGGIMITASHNPAEYNGFKMAFENGLPLGKNTGMDRLRAHAETFYNEARVPQTDSHNRESINVLPAYEERIFNLVPPASLKPLKVVIDAGNGMAAATFPAVVKKLPITAEYLFLQPDGTFPNHEANPLKVETLAALQAKVRETGADLGFALDGDCDRIGLVDEKGDVVDASFVGALVGLEVLRGSGNRGHMFYDLRSSMMVPEVWQAHGATVSMCPVGHALIKKILKDEGGIFASELSLHQYFHSMYDVESSDLSLLYILQALSREQKPLSALIQPLKKYAHSGEINFEIHDKQAVIKKIEEHYTSTALEILHLDGLYMKFTWGWFNVRTSNTEPVLRLNLETFDKTILSQKIKELTTCMLEK